MLFWIIKVTLNTNAPLTANYYASRVDVNAFIKKNRECLWRLSKILKNWIKQNIMITI